MTRALRVAVLYVALALGANPVLGETPDRDTLLELRQGDMRKLKILKEPQKLPTVLLQDMQGGEHEMVELQGKYVLLNFWATWCAPCRKEMPALDALQKDLSGNDFEVVLVAVGRNPTPAIKKFFTKAKIENLQTWRDPTQQLAGLMGVFGLPVTVLLNPDGLEIARMQGDADWHSPDAVEFLKRVLDRNLP